MRTAGLVWLLSLAALCVTTLTGLSRPADSVRIRFVVTYGAASGRVILSSAALPGHAAAACRSRGPLAATAYTDSCGAEERREAGRR